MGPFLGSFMESVMGSVVVSDMGSIGLVSHVAGLRVSSVMESVIGLIMQLSFFLAILGSKRKGKIVKGYNHQYDDASPSSLSAMITSGAGVRLVLKSRTWDPAGSLLDTLLWFDHRHSHCCH